MNEGVDVHALGGFPCVSVQSCGSPNLGSFGTKNHLDVASIERRREYYMGEGGGFPQVQVVVSLVSSKLPVACPSTKGAPNSVLTN